MVGWRQAIGAISAGRYVQLVLNTAPPMKQVLRVPAKDGGVEMTKVVFTPCGAPKPALQGLSLSIGAGEAVGVVGPSGAGQLQGAPSVLFDAVALVLSDAGCELLLGEGAAVDFAKDAFGHLKAIGHTPEAQSLLDKAGVQPDARIVALGKDAKAFVKAAAGRQWDREPKVRILA